ncbi:tyrosine recombinase XerD [Candidatus Marinamargulisbacteria bacterium SCGC AAA071-K20]|nr:tyrosine recombinase XerD [Candidatus Marinamargulisbacteria bacterium SCGC AAA071-K20]
MSTELKSFQTYLGLEKGLSTHSISAYSGDVSLFLSVCGMPKNSTIKVQLNTFTIVLKQKGYSESTVQRKYSSVREYLNYLYLEGHLSNPPKLSLRGLKSSRRLPKLLSVNSINTMVKQSTDTDPNHFRNNAIIELIYSSGMRVSELTSLSLAKYGVDIHMIEVVGKGAKERYVPVSATAKNWIDAYLNNERPGLSVKSKSSALFLNNRGTSISRQQVFNIIKTRGQKAGLPQVSPHQLRHSFASHLLSGGADLRDIQQLLGHSNILTTQVYSHVNKDHLKEVYMTSHPRGASC